MTARSILLFLLLPVLLAACTARPATATLPLGEELCDDPLQVVEAFYAANDGEDFAASLELLTDDVALVSWAEGVNGHHMVPRFAVGKDQVVAYLSEPGLRRTAIAADRPNFEAENQRASGNTVRFELMPDRLRENGRPFNHYSVEFVFKGCRIELIKVVERVTWL